MASGTANERDVNDFETQAASHGLWSPGQVRLELVSAPSSASAARRAVDALLDEKGPEELRTALKLVVSELVTNAVVHGSPDDRIQLTLALGREHVHVSVQNFGGTAQATKLRRNIDGGRGLEIVAALAETWSIEKGPSGTIVTARVRREPSAK